MKKALVLFSILALALTSYAQSGIGINFCGKTQAKSNKTTLTINQLLECAELTVNNGNYNIYSCKAVVSLDGDVKTIELKGEKFSEKLIKNIKKIKPNKIYFETIILIDHMGNKIYGAHHTVIIKK